MIWLLLLILPYSVTISLAWLYLTKGQKDKPGTKSKENLPKVSVIIAARNEEANLPSLLADLQKLDYPPKKLEIILINDNSTDRTAKIIKESTGYICLESSGKGKKQAIATGLKQASGELILTSDADCRIPRGWIRSHVHKYIYDSADLIIGQVKTLPGKGLIQVFSDLEFSNLQAVTGGLALAGHPIMCNGANLGFRRKSVPDYLEAVRADLSSGDDMFLLHFIKKNSMKICWLNYAEGIVETRMPVKAGSFLKQRSRWAGKAVFFRDTDTVLLAISTLLGNLSLLLSIILLLISKSFLLLAVLSYFFKTIPEILLLAKYLEKPGKLRKLLAFIPLSLLYPLYVIVVGIISQTRKNKW